MGLQFSEVLLAGIAILILYALDVLRRKSRKSYPVGPPSLPLLGSLPFIPKDVLNSRTQRMEDYLADKYGDIVAFNAPGIAMVVVSDVDVLKRLYKMEELSDRPNFAPYHKLRMGNEDGKSRGLIFSSGEEWKEQRRFALRTLRDLGFGKASMEDLMNNEANKLVEALRNKHEGKVMQLNLQMNISIVNALWVVISGEQLALDDPKLLSIVNSIDELLRSDDQPNLFLMAVSPWLVETFSGSYKFAVALNDRIRKLVLPYIKEHMKNGVPEDSNDFIDSYLMEINQAKDKSGSSFHGKLGQDSLLISLLDLFVAGTETTSSTLLWAFLFMVNYPEIQEKVYREIYSVLGDAPLAGLEDKVRLPYTCAVLSEVQRRGTIVPKVQRAAIADFKLNGQTIPKGTIVRGNLMRIHHDERYWSDPMAFNPDRFIDKETGAFVSSNNLIPFSIGKRFCLGQALAEKELFLFFVALIKAFKFEASPEHPLPSCDYRDGNKRAMIRNAPLYKVVLKARQ